jgi:hypothetical protein
MAILNKWRVYCDTDAQYEYWWLEDGVAAPTICPTDSGHTIDVEKTAVIETSGEGPTTSEGTPVFHQDCAHEEDDRLVMVNFPAREGSMIWLTGAGDDLNPTSPASGRGEGQVLEVAFTEPGTQSAELEFLEPLELHDGRLFVTDVSQWTPTDRWSFSVEIAASTPTVNGTTTGNCNLVDQGGYNVIVPAAGDGTHDIDLDNDAYPVPTSFTVDGYWDVDKVTGATTASTIPGSAEWHLIDTPLTSFFMKNVPIPCHPMGAFDFDAYKAEWISHKWKLKLSVTRATAGAGKIAGWLVLFREHST